MRARVRAKVRDRARVRVRIRVRGMVGFEVGLSVALAHLSIGSGHNLPPLSIMQHHLHACMELTEPRPTIHHNLLDSRRSKRAYTLVLELE